MSPTAERIFDLGKLGPPLGVLPRGLLIAHVGHPAAANRLARRGARIVAVSEQQYVAHVALPRDSLAAAGLAAVRDGHVAGAVMHEGGNADAARLALAFATYLDGRRHLDPRPVRPCVTSAGAPDVALASGLVRLPHLVTLLDSSGGLSDDVVWEVMTLTQAGRWLGGPIPGQTLFEKQLPALLQLRSLIRTGKLPANELGSCLRELLAGRYLSIRMVYQHPDLFTALIRAVPAPPAPGGWDE
jgi:hypothetical protein